MWGGVGVVRALVQVVWRVVMEIEKETCSYSARQTSLRLCGHKGGSREALLVC